MSNNLSDETAETPRAASRRARPNTGRVTITSLAKLVGVTKVTISRALNTPHLVSPDTLRRVQEAVRETGYIPNLAAGSLASNRSRLVVALVPSVSGSVFQETTEAITLALRQRGYQLLVGQVGYDESSEEVLIEEILGRRPAGIVLTGVVHSQNVRQRLVASDIPIVETWDLTASPIDMLAGFSHEQVGRQAAEFLYQRGARRPAVITPDDKRAMKRANVFCEAMRGMLGKDAIALRAVKAPTHLGDGRHALASLLETDPDIDAVFCAADSLALGVLIEARATGMAVPGRLRVLGYGDLEFAKDTDPPLTTLRIDGTRIGKLAAHMLIERIEGRDVEQPIVDVGFQLMIRSSA
ncbi:LacI family DNA-binding transcriptional regulator [Massilia niastensis]|uniref:LacI family DNA-binding transcriptional regulator n=1 Tax=Massilia niastensis TaxID=544911 RepID=UPI00047658DB